MPVSIEKSMRVNAFAILILLSPLVKAQSGPAARVGEGAMRAESPSVDAPKRDPNVVVITGVRFSYPLVQQWIDDYTVTNPGVQIIIEYRGSSDPSAYDILVDAYEPDNETKRTRDYDYVARYPILPVANSRSEFAAKYGAKGITADMITQIFFHDLFAETGEQREITVPYTVYTRLQKAGVPIVFAAYFGYEQKDIKGKAIAGSDEHLLKALLRDSTGVSYLPLTLIYDKASRRPVDGLAVLPTDLNGNNRVSDDEKFYDDLDAVIERFENTIPKDLGNIPIGLIHLSVDKRTASPAATAFIKWVRDNGQKHLHDLGYLGGK